MASVVSSLSLLSSLKKAATATLYQEDFDFLGLKITLRCLRKEETQAVSEEMTAFSRHVETEYGEEVKNVRYLYEFCCRTLVRSIVAIDGQRLGSDVNVQLEDGTKVESFVFLREHFLRALSDYDFDSLWECYAKVTSRAEEAVKKRLEILPPEGERPDETADRLIREFAKVSAQLPSELPRRILEKHGFFELVPNSPVDEGDSDPSQVSPPAPAPVILPFTPPPPPAADSPQSSPSAVDGHVTPSVPKGGQRLPSDLDPSIPVSPMQVTSLADLRDGELRRAPKEVTVPVDQPPIPGINPRFRPPSVL